LWEIRFKEQNAEKGVNGGQGRPLGGVNMAMKGLVRHPNNKKKPDKWGSQHNVVQQGDIGGKNRSVQYIAGGDSAREEIHEVRG